jgi:hypothetical protein
MPDDYGVRAEMAALREELEKMRALRDGDRALLDRLVQRYSAQDIAVRQLIDIGRRLGRAERDRELGIMPARRRERTGHARLRAVTGR